MWIAWTWALVAHGGEAEAERYRLHTELGALAEKNAWAGVERTFVELAALGLPLEVEDWMLGAQAARVEGNLIEALVRVQRALQVEAAPDDPTYRTAKEVEQQLLSRYGFVHVVVYTPGKRIPPLVRDDMPFAPEEQKAIAWAQARLAGTRAFMGLLPLGEYAVADQRFEVVAGAPMLEVRVGTPPEAGTVVTSP